MRLVSNQTHRENIAQRHFDKMRIFANQVRESFDKVVERFLGGSHTALQVTPSPHSLSAF